MWDMEFPGIVMEVTEDHKILNINDQYSKLSKYNAKELIGETINKSIKLEEGWFGELQLKAKTGEPFYLQARIYPKKGMPQTKSFFLVCHDITQYKKREELLDLKYSRIQLILEVGEIGTWELNLDTNEYKWDDLIIKMHGYTGHALPSRQEIMDRISKKSLPDVISNINLVAEGKLSKVIFEYDFNSPDNHIRSFENRITCITADNGEKIILGTCHETTAQKLAERQSLERQMKERSAIRASVESSYRQILDGISDMILVKGPKSKIFWANKAFCKYYGMTAQELDGLIDAPLVEPDMTQQYIRDDAKVWETGIELDVEEPVRRYDGEICIYHTKKSAIFDENKNVIMTVGISRNITDKKIFEDQLLKAREAAEKANMAKSTFLANMSHELRTPLHGIVSFARFGQMNIGKTSEEKLKNYFTEIYESGQSLMRLLNDLLDLSKLEAGKVLYNFEQSDLIQLSDSIASEMDAFALEKKIKIVIERDPGPATGEFDSFRIGQVLRNLISNAIKFSFQETSVRIKIQANTNHLSCQVINHGVGIPENELTTIFEKFVQSSRTDSGAGGTGLGLAICQEIIKSHNGTLEVRSETGGETCFTFVIPKRHVDGEINE